jgi:hypothetical protein
MNKYCMMTAVLLLLGNDIASSELGWSISFNSVELSREKKEAIREKKEALLFFLDNLQGALNVFTREHDIVWADWDPDGGTFIVSVKKVGDSPVFTFTLLIPPTLLTMKDTTLWIGILTIFSSSRRTRSTTGYPYNLEEFARWLRYVATERDLVHPDFIQTFREAQVKRASQAKQASQVQLEKVINSSLAEWDEAHSNVKVNFNWLDLDEDS